MSDKPTVVEALLAVMADVQKISKAGRNQQQQYSFRGVDATVNAVGPALREHHVIVVPILEAARYRDVQTSTGKPSRECTVEVRYRFYGPAGDFLDAVVPGESMDSGDKGTPKAMSVAFRTALLQALCVPTDDPEPDAHTYERSSHDGEWYTSAPQPPRAKITLIQTLFGRIGIKDRADKLRACSEIAGREIRSANDLSSDEADQVIEALKFAETQPDPPLALMGLVAETAAKDHDKEVPS